MVNLFNEITSDFEDLINHKEITLNITEKVDSLIVNMNKDLAYILANNLIKNAVSHNKKKGYINLCFDINSITISNDGDPVDADIFERYVSASNDSKSSGLGLSIVKSITDKYKFKLTYEYNKMHIFSIFFH